MDPDVQLAANGDVEAFERIYRRHHSRVYTLCLRMVRNATQAEDLTQEVFIQLHRKLHTFRGDALITTWLHRLTVNQVFMHFRKPIVKSEFTTDDKATPVPVASGTERPDRMAVLIASHLWKQSNNWRQVIAWYYFFMTWRAMNTTRSQRCSVVRLELQNRNCTKPA